MKRALIILLCLVLCCPFVGAQTLEQAKKQQVERALAGPNGPAMKKAVKKYSAMYNLEESLIWAVILTESGLNPKAVSSGNCSGLMQLAPATFKARGVGNNIFDIDQNIWAGSMHLSGMIARYNGNVHKGLGSYNMGGGAFDKTYKDGKMHPAAKRYCDRVFYHKAIIESMGI